MRTEDLSWAEEAHALTTLAAGVPGFSEAVPTLLRELTAARALGDRSREATRLFGLDLDNLRQSLRNLHDLEEAGVRDGRIAQIAADTRALMTAMSAQARALIDARVAEAAIHASVTATGLREAERTDTLTIAVSHPVPTKASDAAEEVRVPGLRAKVSGAYAIAAVVEEGRFAHVSPKISFLPEGRALDLEPHEVIVLWAGEADATAEDVAANAAYRLEPADTPVRIHGPVFVSRPLSAKKVIAAHNHFRLRPLSRALPAEERSSEEGEPVMNCSTLGGVAGVAVFVIPILLVTGILAALAVLAITAWVLWGALRLTMFGYRWGRNRHISREAKRHGLLPRGG